MNKFYPISLNLNNRLCIVVGGGSVAFRRVYKLLESGAIVKLISPDIIPELKHLIEIYSNLSWVKSPYIGSTDLKGAALVFAATDDPAINKIIGKDANSLGLFINMASSGELSDFIVPSSFNQGALQVSVSTSGKVPGLSKAIKENLQDTFGPEYALLISLLEEIRNLAIAKPNHKTQNHYILSEITANYLSILKDLNAEIDTDTLRQQLISLLK